MKTGKGLPAEATRIEGAELACRKEAVPTARRALACRAPFDLAHADTVFIDGLEVFAKHGVLPEERSLGQKFVVSLALFCDLRQAGEDDDLAATVPYDAVCRETDAFLREQTFKLLETAAEGLAERLLSVYPQLIGLRVRIDKPWAPVGLPLASVGVEIVRGRSS